MGLDDKHNRERARALIPAMVSRRNWVERARDAGRDPLWRGAYSLMLNSAASAVLGLVFWVVAARTRTSQQVGQDGVLIAAMVTLSSISQLNLANTVTRFIPQAGARTRRWALTAYAIAVAATIVGAATFVAVVPLVSHRLGFVRADELLAGAFIGATALWAIFGLQDALMAALRRAPWIPLENSIFGVLKLLLLPLLAAGIAHAIFISWVVPMLLLLAPVNYLIFWRFIPEHVRRHPDTRPLAEVLPSRTLKRLLVGDFLGSAMNQATLVLPPLLVVSLLGSRANAYFYVPFALVTAFDILFFNGAIALVVEGAFANSDVGRLARRVIDRFAKLVLPGVLVFVIAAPLLLLAFGPAYSHRGAGVLRLLACASVFRVVISLFAAVARVQGGGNRILGVYAIVTTLLIPSVLLLYRPLGIDGVALAWLLANAGAAIAVAPLLFRVMRGDASDERIRLLAPRAAKWTARLRDG